MQHYVIKFTNDMRQDSGFRTPVSSTNKTDHHDIAEILLKVAINTIIPTPTNKSDHHDITEILFLMGLMLLNL